MNRRDFLALFRGLAVLPFVRLPNATVAERSRWESAPGVPLPDDFCPTAVYHTIAVYTHSASELASGQAVYIKKYGGKLEPYNGTGHMIGVAARDIAPGEVVEWRIGGNSKDIITSGIARVTWADIDI